jgi:hypothetical protein
MTGQAKPWEDLRVEPVARTTGTNAPTFVKILDDGSGSRGVYLYAFDDAVVGSQKEVFFSMQMPHAWDGGAINIHVHWFGGADGAGAAPRWSLEFCFADIGAVFPATVIGSTNGVNYTDVGSDADITAYKHYVSKFNALSPSASQDNISSILIGRLFRASAHANDTYNGSTCYLLYIDAHFQMNSLGSTDEYTK